MDIGFSQIGSTLAALTALSTASFGLVDATKAFNGGVSNIGARHIRRALEPFDAALHEAVGDGWWTIVRANWIAGVGKTDQKARVKALIKLGLTPETAPRIAKASHVDSDALVQAAGRIAAGKELNDADLNVLGRMSAAIEAIMDAAFEAGDQEYRNICRLLAGAVAVALSVAVWSLWPSYGEGGRPSLLVALTAGLMAVPLAPVAKDLTSALSTAMTALKAARRL